MLPRPHRSSFNWTTCPAPEKGEPLPSPLWALCCAAFLWNSHRLLSKKSLTCFSLMAMIGVFKFCLFFLNPTEKHFLISNPLLAIFLSFLSPFRFSFVQGYSNARHTTSSPLIGYNPSIGLLTPSHRPQCHLWAATKHSRCQISRVQVMHFTIWCKQLQALCKATGISVNVLTPLASHPQHHTSIPLVKILKCFPVAHKGKSPKQSSPPFPTPVVLSPFLRSTASILFGFSPPQGVCKQYLFHLEIFVHFLFLFTPIAPLQRCLFAQVEEFKGSRTIVIEGYVLFLGVQDPAIVFLIDQSLFRQLYMSLT